MMDTLEQQPKYRLLKNGVKALLRLIPLKQFEIGDFYSFYSYNSVERSRVKIGISCTTTAKQTIEYKELFSLWYA